MNGDKQPRSLYDQTTSAAVKNFHRLNDGWQHCPDDIIFNIFFELYQQLKKMDFFELLAPECEIFFRLLKVQGVPEKMVHSDF